MLGNMSPRASHTQKGLKIIKIRSFEGSRGEAFNRVLNKASININQYKLLTLELSNGYNERIVSGRSLGGNGDGLNTNGTSQTRQRHRF